MVGRWEFFYYWKLIKGVDKREIVKISCIIKRLIVYIDK